MFDANVHQKYTHNTKKDIFSLMRFRCIPFFNTNESQSAKKNTIVKCALFIATQSGELGDECKDIWHVQTQDENSGESSGRVARTMNCVTV